MLPPKKFLLFASLTAYLLLPACAGSPWAKDLERSLAADPSLENGSLFGASPAPASPNPSATGQVQLPFNFPSEIPRYPNAELVAVTPADQAPSASMGEVTMTQTRWQTVDSALQVQQFYRDRLQAEGWQLSSPSTNPASSANPGTQSGAPSNSPGATSDPSGGAIEATRNGLQVAIEILSSNNGTEFAVNYNVKSTAATQSAPATAAIPQPGDPAFIGPVPPANWGTSATATPAPSSSPSLSSGSSQAFADLNQAPAELQPYITDLVKLGALPLRSNAEASNTGSTTAKTENTGATSNDFKPNQAITRREYARWLVAANNLIYANQPARKIRLAVASDQPTFQDVPSSDPDFGVIQGLANAGLIPSPLSGDSTVVTFRPNAPLTREEMILWKVPVDLRQALPNATIEAVQQSWGFQDAARIDPKALRAVLADYQNGDLANIRRAFGYTTLFQPKKAATRAEAAAALWFFGLQADGISAKDALQTSQGQTQGQPTQGQIQGP